MNEYYTEQLVKQKTTTATFMKKVGLILLTIFAFYLGIMIPYVFMIVVPLVAFDIYIMKRISFEYEYLYFNGELDIDRIMGKESRKRILSTNVKEITVLAPTGSIELQQYQRIKTFNCSSNTGNKTYELVAKRKGQLVKVIFEPNQTIIDGIRMLAPSKVFLN